MAVAGLAFKFPDEADRLLLLRPMDAYLLCCIVFQRQQETSLKIAGQRLLWLVMFPSWSSGQQRGQLI